MQVAALQEDAAAQERQVAALAARDPRDLWAADLDAFLAALDGEEAAEAGRREELVRQQKQSRGGGGGKVNRLSVTNAIERHSTVCRDRMLHFVLAGQRTSTQRRRRCRGELPLPLDRTGAIGLP